MEINIKQYNQGHSFVLQQTYCRKKMHCKIIDVPCRLLSDYSDCEVTDKQANTIRCNIYLLWR